MAIRWYVNCTRWTPTNQVGAWEATCALNPLKYVFLMGCCCRLDPNLAVSSASVRFSLPSTLIQEWIKCIACVQEEESSRINQFVFKEDAKRALVCTYHSWTIPWYILHEFLLSSSKSVQTIPLLSCLWIWIPLQAGRLLARRFLIDHTNISNSSLKLERTAYGKPYLVGSYARHNMYMYDIM